MEITIFDVLNLLNFKLVGSRYLGLNTESSDYDYMTTNPEIYRKLCEYLYFNKHIYLKMKNPSNNIYIYYPHLYETTQDMIFESK